METLIHLAELAGILIATAIVLGGATLIYSEF